eukprot:TRINITY_DN29300_c0_g1_i1.p1 TRINITY_DN29300_c0_g1~~TRINITY_DN29300_c0_g1_i1.p1  ORF type:complete len:538 (-),score=83.74 TRINITY_DN29300_c0_g1_i1:78-1691(-)
MLPSPALQIPFADGDAHKWADITFKSSPMSNLRLTVDTQWITSRPTSTSALARERRCRGSEVLVPLTARAPANHRERWPWHVERETAPGINGLMPRGRVFESHVADAVEPRRSGLYEFCIVGVDLGTFSKSGDLRYFAWEPTGHNDTTFSAVEVEKRFALEHFGRNVHLPLRPARDLQDAHGKRGIQAGLGAVVRWPDGSSADGLVHGCMLPNVDERGRPVLTVGCRFPPRNSADLVDPLMHRWWRGFAVSREGACERGLQTPIPQSSRAPPASAISSRRPLSAARRMSPAAAAAASAGARSSQRASNDLATTDLEPSFELLPAKRILVLDGTGRLAARVAMAAHLPAEVVAIDESQRPTRTVLKAFRDRCHFIVLEGKLDRAQPALLFPDGDFHMVLLPFTFHRLCGGDEEHFLGLVREALRVSHGFVLIAEDSVSPCTDEAAVRRWKARFRGTLDATVLLDGELRGGFVADHFLSASGCGACRRRFLIVQASQERLAAGFRSSGDGFQAPQAGTACRESAGVNVDWVHAEAARAP